MHDATIDRGGYRPRKFSKERSKEIVARAQDTPIPNKKFTFVEMLHTALLIAQYGWVKKRFEHKKRVVVVLIYPLNPPLIEKLRVASEEK